MIVEEGKSYRIERDERGDTLVVTDSWTPQIGQLMVDGRVDGLDLNYAKGFREPDLEFLEDWPIGRLAVLARTIKDVAPILRLSSSLEVLRVQTAPKAVIDLSQLPALTAVAADWSQIRTTVSAAPQLRDLMVRAYTEVDLTPLRWNTALTRLRFKDRPQVRNLSGVENLQFLMSLAVSLAPLSDLDALGNGEVSLCELDVESCPVRDLTPLLQQRRLTFLNASDCGDLLSLKPLRELRGLSILWLFGTTRVLDNDLSPLCELPHLRELRMRSRRSYRPSVEAIQALCAERDG